MAMALQNVYDPLALVVQGYSRIVLIDDNAKSHAERTRPYEQRKLSCRWESSPVVHKPGILNNHHPKASRSALPSRTVDSLKALVAPLACRRRTIPLNLEDDDADTRGHSQEGDNNTEDGSSVGRGIDAVHNDNGEPLTGQAKYERLMQASALLSEYLRVATEDLCEDVHDDCCHEEDTLTVSTASITSSSQSTMRSSTSTSNACLGSNGASRTTLAERAQQSELPSFPECAPSRIGRDPSHRQGRGFTKPRSTRSLTTNVRKPVRQLSREDVSVRKPVRRRSRDDIVATVAQPAHGG